MEFSVGVFGTLSTISVYFLAFTAAQVPTITPSPTASSSSAARTHTISVGIDHKFKPEVTQTEPGDLIEFAFFPPNHSVVRAEYENPCIPYEMTGKGKTGFFSGFHPVDAFLNNPPTWTLRINDTNPIFAYCSAPGSCIKYGMVAVINPVRLSFHNFLFHKMNSTTSLEKQKQLAKDSSYMLQPGEPFPPESPSSSSSSSTASATSSSSSRPSSSETAAAAVSQSPKSSPTLSKGAIAGIAVAAASILILAAALFFFIGHSRTLKDQIKRTSTAAPQTPSMYQHPSFLGAPPSDIANSCNSAAVGPPGNIPHDNTVGMLPPMLGMAGGLAEEPKAEYYVVDEGVRDGTTNHPPRAGSETGYGINLNAPRRHPSLAVNPNNPREMEANDGRYNNWT
ncbi:hypothetical protein DM02DRAFT_731289 [Periconia macrospinosa]|uniref:Cupredoxin n=1 Tax=Periconia macrospinosa TaxID=97972 RepID=A0A2V1DGK9_9PLEO|nr:hypothetical protein DM02DRAFT_731289 [Periconia macrospinosa]